MSAHRKNLVKEKKKYVGYKCVSIALDFPVKFRDFFCIHYSRNTKRVFKTKKYRMLLNVHRKIVVKQKKIKSLCPRWQNKKEMLAFVNCSPEILTGEPRNISPGILEFPSQIPRPTIPGKLWGNGRGRGRLGPCCMYDDCKTTSNQINLSTERG